VLLVSHIHIMLFSPCDYSIIRAKKFVNTGKSKQFMNE